ncbi:hypothetical protein F5Y17DRAFT_432355 [Xylariaceae sp. FL0594]|nr:hypothetical protein F5Y17DRAFT_432355 [Xylariaceae sp. FL0594]
MSFLLKTLTLLAVVAGSVQATPLDGTTTTSPSTTTGPETCTHATPGTTGSWPISYYAQATPTGDAFANKGYMPDPVWAKGHLVGTYTYAASVPQATGSPTTTDRATDDLLAYYEFKCQYYCEDGGASFFVRGVVNVGYTCDCYDELLDPSNFRVDDDDNNKRDVGAWNSICKPDPTPTAGAGAEKVSVRGLLY